MVTGRLGRAPTVRPLAVFDLDSTLADVQHRIHWLEGPWKDYGSFFADAVRDPPLAQGVALVLEAARECEVAYVTGRPEWCRQDTVSWLGQHGLPLGPLLMRRNGDHRPARLVKLQLLESLAQGRVVAVVVDDDEQVCHAYEQHGYRVLRAHWAKESEALERAQEQEGRT